MEWATRDSVWPTFDGWCASRNVESLDLPWDRWLNLVYYFATRNMSSEDKKELDDDIAKRVTEYDLARSKPAIDAAMAKTSQPEAKQGRKRPPRPAWYGDDKTNTFNSKAAVATLTAPGVSGKRRGK
jgi:hypothetical protein